MASMQSAAPARKVWVGSVVGAATTLIIAIIEAVGNTKVSGTIAVAISTVLTFVISYIVPPSPNDQVVG